MKYLFILLFIIVYTVSNREIGFTIHSPVYTHLTYMFQHAGVVHLFCNSIAFLSLFIVLEKLISQRVITLLILTGGFTASFFSMAEIPTVGASAMIYGMFGIFIIFSILSNKTKITDTRRYLLFLCSVFLCLGISYYKPNSNFSLHLFSLILTAVYALPYCIWKNHY